MAKIAGILQDGHRTTISIVGGDFPNALLLEVVRIKPMSLDGRGSIDTTSMLNDEVTTESPKKLYKVGPVTFVASYGPGALENIRLIYLNKVFQYGLNWPNGKITLFYGFISIFDPQEVGEGEQPRAHGTIVIGNSRPVVGAPWQQGTESPPVFATN